MSPDNLPFDAATVEDNSTFNQNKATPANLDKAQKYIYQFFRDSVNHDLPETTLQYFEDLFFWGDREKTTDLTLIASLREIIFNAYHKEEFINTLKRVCYIIVNNWNINHKHQCLQQLMQLFENLKSLPAPRSSSQNLLRVWLGEFVKSESYQELKIFTSEHSSHWLSHYTAHLLAPQYLDLNKSQEQREAAKNLAITLKNKFNLELSRYASRFHKKTQTDVSKKDARKNRLLKKLFKTKAKFSYENYARIFLKQTQNLTYYNFKQALKRYLNFSLKKGESGKTLEEKIASYLDKLYERRDHDSLNSQLLLRTCEKLVALLMTEDGETPSYLFTLLLIQNGSMAITITLLKIVLICQQVQSKIELNIARLIKYHEYLPEEECQSFIRFLETFELVFAIYAENIEYNLVKTNPEKNSYRIFPQLKGRDYRKADLREKDFRNADLRLGKLSEANLSFAVLEGAQLTIARMHKTDLSSAKLNGADLRRAELNQANLSYAQLNNAKLRRATLLGTNLNHSSLHHASLDAADLSKANLSNADLSNADLSNANLSNANIEGANLENALLYKTKLHYANLKGANLTGAKFKKASLIGANLAEANLKDTIFDEVNLSGTNLCDTNLSLAKVKNSQFRDLRK
ncbi:MAG: pentapeptide repeat-containing protein [Spirulinaceae cyanobacterium]